MPMEIHWKFRNPRNISGASQRNSVAAFFSFSYTTEVDGDLCLKNKIQRKHKMAPYSLSKSAGSARNKFMAF